jgi:hypothetical protein
MYCAERQALLIPLSLLMAAFVLYMSLKAKRRQRGETVPTNGTFSLVPLLLCAMCFFLGGTVTH